MNVSFDSLFFLILIIVWEYENEWVQFNYDNHEWMNYYKEVDTKDRHSISSYYSMHYARYLRKIKGQSKMAMKVIKTAINNDPVSGELKQLRWFIPLQSNETLYHALIDLHYEKYPLDIESIKDVE